MLQVKERHRYSECCCACLPYSPWIWKNVYSSSAYAYRCYYCVLSICKKMYVKIKGNVCWKYGVKERQAWYDALQIVFCCARHIFPIHYSKYYLWLISVFFQKFTYQYENKFLVIIMIEKWFPKCFRQVHLYCGAWVYTLFCRLFIRSLCCSYTTLFSISSLSRQTLWNTLWSTSLHYFFWKQLTTRSNFSFVCFVVARMYLHGNLEIPHLFLKTTLIKVFAAKNMLFLYVCLLWQLLLLPSSGVLSQ